MPDPAPAVGAVRHRRLRDHPGDVDAAHAGPPQPDHRCRASAFRANRVRRDVRVGAGRAGADSAGLPVAAAHDPHRRAASICRGWATRCPTGGSGRPGPAGPRACSTTPSRYGRPRALPSGCTWSDSRCPAPRRTDRAARWNSPGAARRAVADAATSLMDAGERAGVQMPFGCRMGICQSCVVELGRRPRPRPAHRRRTRTGNPGTDMHFRSIRRLRTGHLSFTGW